MHEWMFPRSVIWCLGAKLWATGWEIMVGEERGLLSDVWTSNMMYGWLLHPCSLAHQHRGALASPFEWSGTLRCMYLEKGIIEEEKQWFHLHTTFPLYVEDPCER